jgi:hypothetical protein
VSLKIYFWKNSKIIFSRKQIKLLQFTNVLQKLIFTPQKTGEFLICNRSRLGIECGRGVPVVRFKKIITQIARRDSEVAVTSNDHWKAPRTNQREIYNDVTRTEEDTNLQFSTYD